MTAHRARGRARLGPIPVKARRWLYGIAASVAPLAIVYGYATEAESVLWLNVIGAALFIMATGNTPTRPSELEPPRAQ